MGHLPTQNKSAQRGGKTEFLFDIIFRGIRNKKSRIFRYGLPLDFYLVRGINHSTRGVIKTLKYNHCQLIQVIHIINIVVLYGSYRVDSCQGGTPR